VVQKHGGRLLVLPRNSPTTAEGAQVLCSQRANRGLSLSRVVVGDVVTFLPLPPEPDERGVSRRLGVITACEARRSLLQAPASSLPPSSKAALALTRTSSAQWKPLAANVDQVLVVVAGSPLAPAQSVDRLLVAAHSHGLRAVLVHNKADLAAAPAAQELLAHYPALGYPVLQVSARSGQGLAELRAELRCRSSILLGQSGVGKSSLVRALLADAELSATAEEAGKEEEEEEGRAFDEELRWLGRSHARGPLVGCLVHSIKPQGAHTTSSARLWHLPPQQPSDAAYIGPSDAAAPHAGCVVDSPGIRELGVWQLTRRQIALGFSEIHALSQRCRYKNCTHMEGMVAAGCAVQRGVAAGLVHPSRLEHYHALMHE